MNTKADIIEIAKVQLALDYNCCFSEFDKSENTIVQNKLNTGRCIYRSDGCFFKAACFCGKVIINTESEMIPWCQEKFLKCDSSWLFLYPRLRDIDMKLHEFGHEIADVHHYYLPNPILQTIKPQVDIKWYEYEDIMQFKNDDRFSEAFAFDDNHPDMLAVAALEGDYIMGMAGASADSKTMWQIGIDVLTEYRSRGIAKQLVSLLSQEILKRGIVPFYGTVESHIYSQNIAINAGFFPAWAEIYSKTRH